MKKRTLIRELENMPNAGRQNRDRVAGFVLENPENFPELLQLVFNNKGRLSVKAAWILELVCQEDLDLIIPFIDFFSRNLPLINDESALRPLSKVVLFLAKENERSTKLLANNVIESFITVSFDWLISNRKVATQSFAMENLFILGKIKNWVHPELKEILQQNLIHKSPGYQSKAKKILAKLNKSSRFTS